MAIASTAVAAALGMGLGVMTGIPLGVVNVAVVEAALAGRVRYATGLGVGGALADMTHAGLAFIGVGRLVTLDSTWTHAMALVAAVIILGYGVIRWRARRAPRPELAGTGRGRGVVAGTLLTLPNPGSLAAWVAVAAAVWPTIEPPDALALALGVGLGSATWFACLARWVSRVRPDHPARAWMPKIAVAVLVASALGGVARLLFA